MVSIDNLTINVKHWIVYMLHDGKENMTLKAKQASNCGCYCKRICHYLNIKEEQCMLYYNKIDESKSALLRLPIDHENGLNSDYQFYTIPQCRYTFN